MSFAKSRLVATTAANLLEIGFVCLLRDSPFFERLPQLNDAIVLGGNPRFGFGRDGWLFPFGRDLGRRRLRCRLFLFRPSAHEGTANPESWQHEGERDDDGNPDYSQSRGNEEGRT